ncbi:MAG: hypothetical protein H0U74_08775 [Bradymonadaceae bacterium]|nr:hypothetical protein [Lujinxingiaceae bacterium]
MAVCGLLASGCWDKREPSDQAPLQPLIYTEYPNLTPEAAAVRERRLVRQLMDGAGSGGQWGDLETSPVQAMPALDNAQKLGEAIFEALIDRREALWEHVFVSPLAYSQLVHVDMEAAREFVDNLQGKSFAAWKLFDVEQSSELAEGGLKALVSLDELRLGQGRTVDGPVAKDEEAIVQYWGNILVLRFKQTDVRFEIAIPKIVRVADPLQGGASVLALASEIRMDRRLEVLLRMGLHLKAELMRSREYPYPLKVGNFWRYRRYNAAASNDPLDLLDQVSDDPSVVLDASEVLLEVEAIDRYETIRLVRLARTYNDQRLSRYIEHWLLTPRHIYLCPRPCQNNIENIGWLLEYFDNQTPIYRFALTPSMAWKRGGADASTDAVFRVDPTWQSMETAAGTFSAVVAITGTGALGQVDRHLAGAGQRRYFATGKGVIKRVLKNKDVEITEELVETRIMP